MLHAKHCFSKGACGKVSVTLGYCEPTVRLFFCLLRDIGTARATSFSNRRFRSRHPVTLSGLPDTALSRYRRPVGHRSVGEPEGLLPAGSVAIKYFLRYAVRRAVRRRWRLFLLAGCRRQERLAVTTAPTAARSLAPAFADAYAQNFFKRDGWSNKI